MDRRTARRSKAPDLRLGFDVADGLPVSLAGEHLETHVHIMGPTGCGKSRLLLSFFQQLVSRRDSAVVLMNPKGALGRMARDWAIRHGHTGRLIFFDPGDPEMVLGYNPLSRNGLAVETQAKAVREAILAGFGQRGVDETPQLARWLFVALAVARELELTPTEALAILRPGSPMRAAVLPLIRNQHLRELLEYLDGLKEQRQDELLASTLVRLEQLILDPHIRRILTQERSLDFAEVLADGKLLIVNNVRNRPLPEADQKVLNRLIINHLLQEVNARGPGGPPVFLLIDEVHESATSYLCAGFDQGRELGLHIIAAHQYEEQLLLEDESRRLLASVRHDATTKIIFGGGWVGDLRAPVENAFLSEVDPLRVKTTQLECEPVETTRTSVTTGTASSRERGVSCTTSETDGKNRGTTTTVGKTLEFSRQRDQTVAQTDTEGTARTQARGESRAHAKTFAHGQHRARGESFADADHEGESDSASEAVAIGSILAPDAFYPTQSTTDVSGTGLAHQRGHTTVSGVSSAEGESDLEADSYIEGESQLAATSHQRSHSAQRAERRGRGVGVGISHQAGQQTGNSQSRTRGTTASASRGESETRSKTTVPFHEYHKRRVPSIFWSEAEQLTEFVKLVHGLPSRHYLIKVPGKRPLIIRAPEVPEPRIGHRLLEAARRRLFAAPYYARPEQIDDEERARHARLLEAAGPRKRRKGEYSC
jgi:hypothetical protein